MIQRILFIVHFFCICLPFVVYGQDDWQSKEPDQLLTLAREESFHGDRERARVMLQYILAQAPQNHDVRILLGRTYAWDGRADEARKELQAVLSQSPDHPDALNAMIDVEMWSKQYERALQLADIFLEINATAVDVLLKRAQICYALGNESDAVRSLHQLLSVEPSHAAGRTLLKSIETDNLTYTAGISYGIDFFSRIFDPAQYSSVEIGRRNMWGTSLLRFNYTNRFATHGLQGEIDLYPKISQGIYAYLNYAYAGTGLFPEHKAGGELYFKFPYQLEGSGGVRYMHFPEVAKVKIYTGSLGWYFKNYWLSARLFVTPQQADRNSVAMSVFLRRYFATRHDYLGIVAGIGFSPDERRFQSGAGLTTDRIYDLRSRRVGLVWSKVLPRQYIFSLEATITGQEQDAELEDDLRIIHTGLVLKRRF